MLCSVFSLGVELSSEVGAVGNFKRRRVFVIVVLGVQSEQRLPCGLYTGLFMHARNTDVIYFIVAQGTVHERICFQRLPELCKRILLKAITSHYGKKGRCRCIIDRLQQCYNRCRVKCSTRAWKG